MVTWLQLPSILLICLLSELENSSAFPKATASVYPEAWQGLREQPQERYNPGTRRPLQRIQTLRQAQRKKQPNVHDQVWVNPWQKPQGSFLSYSQPQNQPSLYHQTQNPKHTSLPQSPSERNHPLPIPRSFEFSLKVPFSSSLGNKETSQTTKGSDVNNGGSDGASHSSQSYRPISVQLHSSFNKPSGSDEFLGKGSTKDPNAGKNVHEVSKPSFELSLSVPIPSTAHSPKPSSNDGGYFTNIQRPGTSGFVQNSYTQPSTPQTSSTQRESEWPLLNQMQQQTEQQLYEPDNTEHTESKTVTFFPGYVGTYPGQGGIHGQSQVFEKLVETPSLPVYQYPEQSDNVYSGYYNPQIKPTKGESGQTVSPYPTKIGLALTPSQYEEVQSGHYSAVPVKPGGNVRHQTWQPVGTRPTFASDGYEQNVKTDSYSSPIHSASPIVAPSQYELPHYPTGDMVHLGQSDLSSAYQYSKGQSGQDVLSNTYLTASHSSPNFQDLSTQSQSQMTLPGQDTGGQMKGNPSYTKLFIDVEDVSDGGEGQNYFAAPSAYYDGYSGLSKGETHVGKPSPLSAKLESLISVTHDQVTGLLSSTIETYPSQTQDSYIPKINQALSMDSGVGQYTSYPQKQRQTEKLQTYGSVTGQVNKAPQVTANTGQQHVQLQQPISDQSDGNYYAVSPSNGYHVGQMQLWQPTSDQSTDDYYAVSPSNGYHVGQMQLQQPTSDQSTDSYYAVSPVEYSVNQIQVQQPTSAQTTNNYAVSASNGYHDGQMQLQQPISDQSSNYYAMSVNKLNPYNAYKLNH